MASFGSLNHMVITLRNNAKLLRKRSLFKKERSFLRGEEMEFKHSYQGIPSKPVSKEKLQKIKEKIQQEQRRDRNKLMLITLFFLPLIVFSVYTAFKDFTFGFPKLITSNNHELIPLQEKQKKYYFYIEDGDAWLAKHHYNNAIFQYRNALKVFPSEYDAQYRLALALSYQCQYKFEGCEEGNKLIHRLLQNDPTNEKLLTVKDVFIHWGSTP